MIGWLRSIARPNHVAASSDGFRPLPFLSNAHAQTLLGSWLKGRPLAHASRERHVPLADGDRLALHDSVPAGWRPGDGVVLLIHGLGGTHRSPYLQRLAALLLPQGLRVVRMDLRGCGRGTRLARRAYNGGCSEDVRAVAEQLRQLAPGSPLVLAGISLGGNIALKLAGEAHDRPVPNLHAVAALSPPIDLERCAELIALPSNRVYDRHFVQCLVSQVRRRGYLFPDLPAVRFPRRLTMRQFDELYTAPQGGFADALDYYRRSSSSSLISRIGVPTFILTARDDPFIAVGPFEALRAPGHVHVQVIDHGGHVGFLGWDGSGGIRWGERRLADWVAQVFVGQAGGNGRPGKLEALRS